MGGPAGWHVMRSLSRDPCVTERRLRPGTIKRIARFAAPYRRYLAWFLALIVVDAGAGNVNPLIYKAIIDDGIIKHRRGLVIALALLIAGLAIVSAAVNLANRWYSARIGEG